MGASAFYFLVSSVAVLIKSISIVMIQKQQLRK